jgi:hypothetical protein
MMMRKLFALTLLALLFPFASEGRERADDFSLSITVTRGERSRDSHSQTTRINLKGRNLSYEKSYAGFRGGARSAPVKKSFRLTEQDVEKLKNIVRDKELLTSELLALASADGGVRGYFEITLGINLDGKSSGIGIRGPRGGAAIREKPLYLRANALLDAVYSILSAQDKEIGYENRDLISD